MGNYQEGSGDRSPRAVVAPLISMTVFQVMVSMSVLTVPVLAVPVAADLGIAPGAIGYYMSVVFAVAMAGAILGGHAVRLLGAVRMAQLCLVLAAAALVTLSSGMLALAVPAAVLMGAAYGPATPVSSHILARDTPPHLMPIVFSVKQTGVPAGGALAGALVPPLVLLWGWQEASVAVAATCLVVAATLQPLRARLDHDREPARRLQGGFFGPVRLVLDTPVLRRMAFLSFAFSAVQMSMIAYLVTYLVDALGLDLVTAGMVLATALLAGVAGRILWGAVSGTVIAARRLLILLGLVMSGASVVTAGFEPGWPLPALYGTAALFGVTAIGWNGVFLAELARVSPPGQAGLVTGGTIFVTFAGVVVAPALFGLVITAGLGYSGGFLMLAALGLAGAGLLMGTSQGGESRDARI